MNFQQMILTLQQFWAEHNCIIVQPYDTEKGAGTMNPMTFLRSLGPEPWKVAYVEPSRRPSDGRYSENLTGCTSIISSRSSSSLLRTIFRKFTWKV